jgi:DNA modification methylase
VTWVLDALGYEEGDTVDDLFPGSGAVSAAIAQMGRVG